MIPEYAEALDIISRHSNQLVTVPDFSTLTRDDYANVRPHPVIWTDERVAAWRRDGIRRPVAVWTLRQLITFLARGEHERLAGLWWLIALRGLRRGEAAALHRDDLDSAASELTIARQLNALPGQL